MVAKPTLRPLAIQLVLESVILSEGSGSSLEDSSPQRHLISTKCTLSKGCLFCPSVFPSHLELLLFKQVLGFPWITLSFPLLTRGHWGWEHMSNFYFITLFYSTKKKKKCRRNVLEYISKMNVGFSPCSRKIKETHLLSLRIWSGDFQFVEVRKCVIADSNQTANMAKSKETN